MIFHKEKFEVIPLYKEFLHFLKKKDFYSIEKNYLGKYEEYFEKFCPRWELFEKKEIIERIKKAKIFHYSNVFEFDSRVYSEMNKLLKKIDKALLADLLCKIMLYIGFFCPDGKTIVHNDEIIIGISVDRINDIRDFPLILAHEIGHAQRRKFFPDVKDSFEEFFFSEGIAFYFSHKVFPEVKIYRNLFIKRGEYSYIMKNIKEIINSLNEKSIKGDIFNFLSFYYIKFLVEKKNFELKDLIQKEKMPLPLENFLFLLKNNIIP